MRIRALALIVTLVVSGLFYGTSIAQEEAVPVIEENIALIEEYLDAISGHEKPVSLQDQYIADSDQALKEHILMFEAGFPLYELIADDIVAQADEVVVRATFRGIHKGEFAGVPATGNEVEIPLIIIYHIEDHKIAEHWMVADALGLMQQIGALPTPES
jgi:predicted ester cyclase